MLRFFRDHTAALPDEHTLVAGTLSWAGGSGTKLAGHGDLPLRPIG